LNVKYKSTFDELNEIKTKEAEKEKLKDD